MSKVLAALTADHQNFASVLNVLEREMRRFSKGEDPDYELIRLIADYLRTYPNMEHHPKEDLVHERLRQRAPDVAEIMGDLGDEHRRLSTLVDRFAAVVDEVLLDADISRDELNTAASEFVDFYRSHMLMEELRFLPAARRNLTAADWDEIDARIAAREDPAFGGAAKPEFNRLVEEIAKITDEPAG